MAWKIRCWPLSERSGPFSISGTVLFSSSKKFLRGRAMSDRVR